MDSKFSSTHVCMDCGNYNKLMRSFYGNAIIIRDFKKGKEYITTDDLGIQKNTVGWVCAECKGVNLMILGSDEELLRVRHLHTDNNNQWHKHILDESKRNKKIGKQIMLENL